MLDITHSGDIYGAGRWMSSFIRHREYDRSGYPGMCLFDPWIMVSSFGLIYSSLIQGAPQILLIYITRLSGYADRITCINPQLGLN